MRDLTRRSFLASATAGALYGAAWDPTRLGISCLLGTTEGSVRKVLSAAREAGFTRAQIQFPWTKVSEDFIRSLPAWLAGEGIEAEVLGAHVNCCAPENVIMDCRRQDFARAIEVAGTLGSRRLVAWTGGYGAGLMQPDPRNFTREAEDNICRFLEPYTNKIEQARLRLALETYITLACPDAPSLARLLKRLPKSVGAVLDPPNLTPVARYPQRDEALREMLRLLKSRVAVVHLKDFRLAADGQSYQLPGPLKGEMNYPMFARGILSLADDTPIIAEHLAPSEFATARRELLPVFEGASLRRQRAAI